MSNNAVAPSSADAVETVSAGLVGSGIIVMALFPLAIPMIALLAVATLPLLLLALAAGLLAALLAAPVLLLRRLWRRYVPVRSRGSTPRAAPRSEQGVSLRSSGVMAR